MDVDEIFLVVYFFLCKEGYPATMTIKRGVAGG